MAVREAQAFLGELIQVGSGDLGLLVVAAEIAETKIVAVENQDIGACCLGGEKREAGSENKQGKGTSHPEITGRKAPVFKRVLTFRTTWPVGGGFIRSRRAHEQDDNLYLGSNRRRCLGPEGNC